MSDLIDRQAAIDAIDDANDGLVEDDYTYGVQNGMEKAKYVIEALPSAQQDIIVCADCKHWICHDRRCGYWNHGVKPLDYCSYAEGR